jgi:sulfoacetaldehyde dehydrogenase
MADPQEAAKYIAGLVARARKAQASIENASQEQVDDLCARVAWSACEPGFAKMLAEKLVAESGMGIPAHKVGKIYTKVKGTWRDMRGKASVGVVENNKETGIIKIAKPMGVVGALIPVTNGEATPFCKALMALKTRNAIIMAAHPRAKETGKLAIDRIRKVLKKQGWPEDLVINVDQISLEGSTELMKQSDFILATGGAGMVKAAYSSGKPAQGVGAGNAVVIVDETADLSVAADMIMRSKTFDHATSCSTENSCLIQEGIYDQMVGEMEKVGGYLVSAEEKKQLQTTMWNEKGQLSRYIVAQSAAKIAELAKIKLPEGKSFFMIPETGIGEGYPFSAEKLSVTTAIYKYKEFADAVEMVNKITTFSGPGHSCGIHTKLDSRVMELGNAVKVSRIMIRQPQCLANSGAWTNGMPMSMTLGCGSWGRTSTTANVTWEHLLNYTWISYPIPSTMPTDRELFGTIMDEEI